MVHKQKTWKEEKNYWGEEKVEVRDGLGLVQSKCIACTFEMGKETFFLLKEEFYFKILSVGLFRDF